jgi:hypothetical protein
MQSLAHATNCQAMYLDKTGGSHRGPCIHPANRVSFLQVAMHTSNASRTSCTVNQSAASTKCLMEWQRVAHRGPARLGSCTAAAQHVMLGHRRLIVLLAVTSPTGINNMLL